MRSALPSLAALASICCAASPLLPAASLPFLTAPAVHAQSRKPVITAYVFPQDRLLGAAEVHAEALTRINYAFANIRGGKMVEGFPATETQNLSTLLALKHTQPALQVLVSVGGWLWSGQFSTMARSPASRALFLDSVVAYIRRHNIDGLDIDWEYPGQAGAGNRFRAEDKENYTALLREMRMRFDVEGQRLGRPLLITIAAGASGEWLAHTEMGAVQRSVDSINLMAYDYYEPSDGPITGNHAPLFTDPADPKAVSADSSVRAMESAGVPAAKLVLGVPFYGHVWGKVPAAHGGLFQPGQPVPNASATYSAIATTMLGHGYTRQWDDAAAVPTLYNASTHTFVSYEDPESLARKGEYVRERGLAGIMFWEYTNDPSGTLVRAVAASLNRPGASR